MNPNNNNNNMPNLPPSGFMNFPFQNGQPFPVNQNVVCPNGPPFPFNTAQLPQQQQGQFFAQNPIMNPNAANEQALLQSTIQNIYQLLQLQNRNQCSPPVGTFPMFQNPIGNVQNPGFIANQQFGMSVPNRPPVMGQQLQPNPFLPGAVTQTQQQQLQNLLATVTNFQNQIPQGVGPQNQNFPANQMLGMPNLNGPMQHANQGQQRFPAPMMNANVLRPMVNTGQTHNPAPMMNANVSKQMVNAGQTQNPGPNTPNLENNHGNMATNANGGRPESLNKNFTGHKGNDASHKGFKSQFNHNKYVKEKGGNRNGIMNKVGNKEAVDSGSRSSTPFKKLPSPNYTEQEIKQWREARKKNFPTSCKQEQQALSDATNQEAMLRRQQLQEILAKQAELGCEVAEIPPSYFSGSNNPYPPRDKKERFKRGKKGKRGNRFNKDNRNNKRMRGAGDQESSYQRHEGKRPKERGESSLLQKLLTHDINRDKNHVLQVLRFIAMNSFFNGEEPLRFPSVVVREKAKEKELEEEEEEGEITD